MFAVRGVVGDWVEWVNEVKARMRTPWLDEGASHREFKTNHRARQCLASVGIAFVGRCAVL